MHALIFLNFQELLQYFALFLLVFTLFFMFALKTRVFGVGARAKRASLIFGLVASTLLLASPLAPQMIKVLAGLFTSATYFILLILFFTFFYFSLSLAIQRWLAFIVAVIFACSLFAGYVMPPIALPPISWAEIFIIAALFILLAFLFWVLSR